LVLSRLGRGGMGTVYRAWQTSIAREVALKLLGDALREEPIALERFMREARITASLRCPHTVRVIDFGLLSDQTPYLAMELVDGVTLDALLADGGALKPARAIELVRQICMALEEAHDQGLVHRDLKPGNIMVTPMADGGDFARVLDFGVAKILDDDSTALTAENSNPGTPAYMAPEQARNEPVGPQADIYALAVILYEMLSGERPFTGTSAVAVLVQHAQTPPPRMTEKRPHLPGVEALDAVLQRGLAKRPVNRYPDAAAFREDLDRLRSGASPLAFAATAEGDSLPALPGVPPKKRMLGLNFQALGCSVQLAIAVGALALFILPNWRDAEAPAGVAEAPAPTALEAAAVGKPVVAPASSVVEAAAPASAAPPMVEPVPPPQARRGPPLEQDEIPEVVERKEDSNLAGAEQAEDLKAEGSQGTAEKDREPEAPEPQQPNRKARPLASGGSPSPPPPIRRPPPRPPADVPAAVQPPAPGAQPDPLAGDGPGGADDGTTVEERTQAEGSGKGSTQSPENERAADKAPAGRAEAIRARQHELAVCGPFALPRFHLRVTVAANGAIAVLEPVEPAVFPQATCLKRAVTGWRLGGTEVERLEVLVEP